MANRSRPRAQRARAEAEAAARRARAAAACRRVRSGRSARVPVPGGLVDALADAGALALRVAVILFDAARGGGRLVTVAEIAERCGSHPASIRRALAALAAVAGRERPGPGLAHRYRLRAPWQAIADALATDPSNAGRIGWVPLAAVDNAYAMAAGSPTLNHHQAAAAIRHAAVSGYSGYAWSPDRRVVVVLERAGILDGGRWARRYRSRPPSGTWRRYRCRRAEWIRRACPRCMGHRSQSTTSTCTDRRGHHQDAPPEGRPWNGRIGCAHSPPPTYIGNPRPSSYPANKPPGGYRRAPPKQGWRLRHPAKAPPEEAKAAADYVAHRIAEGGRVTHPESLARQVAACLAGLVHSAHRGACGRDRWRVLVEDYGIRPPAPKTRHHPRPADYRPGGAPTIPAPSATVSRIVENSRRLAATRDRRPAPPAPAPATAPASSTAADLDWLEDLAARRGIDLHMAISAANDG